MRRSSRCLPAALLLGLLGACGGPRAAPETLTVFAAASLREVAQDLATAFTRGRPAEVVFNFAASNVLERQIESAPGADVFLSAAPEWIDRLERAGLTLPGTRRRILGNRLVLIANRRAAVSLGGPGDLASAAYRALALADPEAVPAGRYARAALARSTTAQGDLWSAVAARVVPTLDVRAALALVESDPEILGIVYRTDALTSGDVRVLYEFPPLPDLPIGYWAVALARGRRPDLARLFVEFLGGAQARALAARRGFDTAG